jgi:hypothetical protein
MKQISEEINFLIIHAFITFGWATQTVICYKRSAFVTAANLRRTTSYNSRRLNYTAGKPEILHVFRCSKYWILCNTQIIRQHSFDRAIWLGEYEEITYDDNT